MNKSNNLDNFCQFFLALLILYLFSIYLAILFPFLFISSISPFLFHFLIVLFNISNILCSLFLSLSSIIFLNFSIIFNHWLYLSFNLSKKSFVLALLISFKIFLIIKTLFNVSVSFLTLVSFILSNASINAFSLSLNFLFLSTHLVRYILNLFFLLFSSASSTAFFNNLNISNQLIPFLNWSHPSFLILLSNIS